MQDLTPPARHSMSKVRIVVEPIVHWLAKLGDICLKRWKVDVERLIPLSESQIPPSVKTFKNGKRLILCCDGGGVRGILTLRALKALEEHVGGRCIDIFDMFAGTSTGAIIAGALAWGVSVDDLIDLYRDHHHQIFTKTLVGSGILLSLAAGLLAFLFGGIGLAMATTLLVYFIATQILVPKYRSRAIKCMLKSLFEEDTLAHCCRDILVTAKDTVRSETIYFTAFHSLHLPFDPGDLSTWLAQTTGTYKNVRLRDAIAASAASAPVYFNPVGRFIDGGVGSYNNVSYAAPVEALRYSGEEQLYRPGQVLVLSLGTGKQINNMKPGEAGKIKTVMGWAGWIIGEGLDDADEQQSYVARNELQLGQNLIRYRRFQMYFTPEGLSELKEIDPSLSTRIDSRDLGLDAVHQFDFLDQTGKAFGQWLRNPRSPGEPVRFELDEIVELGKPTKVRPDKFDISIYSAEVKKELGTEGGG